MEATIMEQIVNGITDVEGIEPEELDFSIHHYVSTDAIRLLVGHESDSWRLQFETRSHVVELTGNDDILVDGEEVQTFSHG